MSKRTQAATEAAQAARHDAALLRAKVSPVATVKAALNQHSPPRNALAGLIAPRRGK